MDKREEVRPQLDAALVPALRGQRGALPALRPRHNLGNFLRRLALPKEIRAWSLRSVQVKLIKTEARMVRHARRIIFQMAEVAVSRELFAAVLKRIDRLRLASG